MKVHDVVNGLSPVPVGLALFLALCVSPAFHAGQLSAQSSVPSVSGRVTDQATQAPVPDATVELSGRATVTDAQGFFRFDSVRAGLYAVRVRHLAYGDFLDQLRVGPGGVQLQVTLSQTALELEPVIVDVRGREEREERERGTQRNVITRDQIVQSLGTAQNLATVLSRNIPGVRIKNTSGRMGGPTCIEFRSGRSLDDPMGCHDPVVFMDGVRVAYPRAIYPSLSLEDVQRLEVIPPGEAGVRYGTDSQYGVLLIETRTGQNRAETPRLERRGIYDWTEEPDPYPWAKVFGTAFLTNAAGVALGTVMARRCLSFDGLAAHFLESECGSWGTAGARVGLIAVPVAAVTFGANSVGGSELSKGRLLQTAVGALIIGVPGYIMATGGEADAFPGADWVGGTLLLIGVPLVTTVADRLFRNLRD